MLITRVDSPFMKAQVYPLITDESEIALSPHYNVLPDGTVTFGGIDLGTVDVSKSHIEQLQLLMQGAEKALQLAGEVTAT